MPNIFMLHPCSLRNAVQTRDSLRRLAHLPLGQQSTLQVCMIFTWPHHTLSLVLFSSRLLESLWPENQSPEKCSGSCFHTWTSAMAAEPALAQALLLLSIFTVGWLSHGQAPAPAPKATTGTTVLFCFIDLREEIIFFINITFLFLVVLAGLSEVLKNVLKSSGYMVYIVGVASPASHTPSFKDKHWSSPWRLPVSSGIPKRFVRHSSMCLGTQQQYFLNRHYL